MEINILKKVLSANDAAAGATRELFSKNRVFSVNLMGSPGSGKTTVIERTILLLKQEFRIGVIEGDIFSTVDAERISKLKVPIVQINTGPFGGDCHLEAGWIKEAAVSLRLEEIDLLFIENVGNLVCPAEFDTGAHTNVVVLSLPEGEDKPIKYPLMFRTCEVMLLNKLDLQNVLKVDIDKLQQYADQINPSLTSFRVSATDGEGFAKWTEWLKRQYESFLTSIQISSEISK